MADTRPDKVSCGTCFFAEEIGGNGTMFCKRFPPGGDYPQTVAHSDWCGEWVDESPWK